MLCDHCICQMSNVTEQALSEALLYAKLRRREAHKITELYNAKKFSQNNAKILYFDVSDESRYAIKLRQKFCEIWAQISEKNERNLGEIQRNSGPYQYVTQ